MKRSELMNENTALREQIAALEARLAENVNQRQLAEKVLIEGSDGFQVLFETIGLGIVYQDAQGAITLVNPAAEQILGLSVEQLRGCKSIDPLRRAIREDGSDFPEQEHPAMIALRTGQAVHRVLMGVYHPQKESYRWILIDAIPEYRAGETQPFRVYKTFEDITARKLAEDALRESERQFRELFETSPVAIYLADVICDAEGQPNDLRFLYVNPVFERFVHSKAADLVGRTAFECFPQGNRATIERQGRVALTGIPDSFEAFSAPLNVYFETTVYSPRYGQCVTFLTDITERKRADAVLREREQKLNTILNLLPVGISILDQDRKLVYSNNTLGKILGTTKEGLLQGDYRSRKYLRADGSERLPEEFASTRVFNERIELHDIVTGVVKEDGQIVWTSVSAAPVDFPDWKVIIVTADITERTRAAEQLRESDEFLRLAYEAANLGIWKNDLQTGSVDFDERARLHYGFDALHTTITELMSRIHPEDVSRLGAEIAAATAPTGNGKFTTEYRVTHPDGSVHYLAIGVRVAFKGVGEGRQAMMGYGTSLDITERKQAEAALRQSEQKYSALFEKAAVPMALTKMPEGVFADVNESFQTSFGYSREEIIGKTSVEIGMARPDERAQSYLDLEKTGSLRNNEKHLFTKAGEARIGTVNINKIVINGQDYVITTIHDVTERKQAQEQLKKMSSLMADGQRIAHLGSFEYDAGTKKVVWSEEEYRIYGYDPAQLAPDYDTMLANSIHPDDTALLDQAFLTAMQKGLVYELEHRIVRPDRSVRWVYDHAYPSFDQNGELIRYVGVTLDITERKRVEEALRQRTEEMKQLLDLLPAAIWIADDPECKVIHGNRFANELLSVTEKDNISQSAEAPAVKLRQFSQGRELGPDELPMQAAARTGQPQLDFELQIDRPDHVNHILLGGAIPLFDTAGRPRGGVAAFYDITERKLAEDELRRSNAELEQFAYVASHDLQEPLRAVAGMVQLLSQRYKGKLDDRADEYIHHAVEASQRMQNLIDDLLNYSRVDRFGKPFAPITLESSIKAALANLEAVIQESQTQITYDRLPAVLADSGQLTQVFQNLIGNALKFRGEHPPRIHIGAEKVDGAWRIAVSDNGIGIEPQYFERIFLVFQRLHTRREYPGTGIGLSLCKKIIERHGGKIWVESQPGQGSTFYFTIPERKT